MNSFPAGAKVRHRPPPFDSSMFLEELPISEGIRERLRRGWSGDMVEFGTERTLSAQMLAERSDEELLEIKGMTNYAIREIRLACKADPGVLENVFPGIKRSEVEPMLTGSFTVDGVQERDQHGRLYADLDPVPAIDEED